MDTDTDVDIDMDTEEIVHIKKSLVVIGGGPAGLAAALEAKRAGIKIEEILIVERDAELGGILNQCIHAGFGIHMFGRELTGPEYATIFTRQIDEEKIQYMLNSMVLSISPDAPGSAANMGKKIITLVSPEKGLCKIEADAVILAMGCRERTRGALNIPGSRPAGVLTAGAAQRYVNIEGYMPGKEVVILGSGDIGLIMARRMTLEGAKVLMVCELMPYSNGLARNIAQCLGDFDIPLKLSHTVIGINGRERVESVVVARVDKNKKPILETAEIVKCDTLMLSVGLIPENELTVEAGVDMDGTTGGAIVNESMMTSANGIFACGNVLHVHDLVDFVTLEGYRAGRSAAAYIKGELEPDDSRNRQESSLCETKAGEGVRYIAPHRVNCKNLREGDKFFFRVDNIYRNCSILVKIDGEVVKKIKKLRVSPSEMESFQADEAFIDRLGITGTKAITVCIEN